MKPSKDLDEQIDEILHKYGAEEGEFTYSIRHELLALIEQRECETMERFGIKKGVEYKVFSGDKVIVLEVVESDK